MPVTPDLLLQLAKSHGTPLYVYDLDLIKQRYQELFTYITWPRLRVLYAMKANYNPAILRALHKIGAWLDTVSPGDVVLARKLGFPVDRILYTANNLTEREMKRVADSGVLMNIGSLSRLEKFAAAYPGSDLCLRFNPDVVDGAHAKIMTGGELTKFGILLEDVDQVCRIVERYRLRVVGLHEHTGSGITRTDSVYQGMRNLLAIATPERFPHLRFVDFGGGFKVPYRPDEERIDYAAFGAEISRIFREFCATYGRDLEMYFEPGKCIVAEGGTMLVTINTLKNNRGRQIAGCDSGFPQLIRPMFYDAYHHIVNLSNPDGRPGIYDVCGNICETGDRFAEQRELPEIREGDVLAIQNAGAYCYAMGGVYNLRPMPPEVAVEGGSAWVARRGLSEDDLIDQLLKECS